MTRKEFVARVRRRALELLLADDTLSLVEAERQAVRELKGSAQAPKPRAVTSPKAGPGAKARLGAMLTAISERMRAVIPPGVMAAPTAAVVHALVPAAQEEAQHAAPASEESPSEVMLIYSSGAGTAQLIPDSDYPPAMQSIATKNWRESLRQRGSS